MDKSDMSFLFSVIAVLVSMLSAIYGKLQAREMQEQRKISLFENLQPLLNAIEYIIEDIQNANDIKILNEHGRQFVRVVRRSEIILDPKLYKKVYELIDKMWDAIREKEAFLSVGGGIPMPDGGVLRPHEKLDNFQYAILSLRCSLPIDLRP